MPGHHNALSTFPFGPLSRTLGPLFGPSKVQLWDMQHPADMSCLSTALLYCFGVSNIPLEFQPPSRTLLHSTQVFPSQCIIWSTNALIYPVPYTENIIAGCGMPKPTQQHMYAQAQAHATAPDASTGQHVCSHIGLIPDVMFPYSQFQYDLDNILRSVSKSTVWLAMLSLSATCRGEPEPDRA